MNRCMKTCLTLFLVSVLLSACLVSPVSAEEPAAGKNPDARPRYGLHVEEDGTITLEGKPFYGFGLNYFGAFCHNESTGNTEPYEEGFAGIEAHGIPVVRFPLGGFYPDYYDRYDADPEGMLDQIEKVLDTAAAHHVGVIGTFFWWEMALSFHVREHRMAIGDPESATIAYAKAYVESVMKRFVNHPAIWGWEIGNEINLQADLASSNEKDFLPSTQFPGYPEGFEMNGQDYITTRDVAVFMTEIASEIRRFDDYRMISTGHAVLRPAAWHLSRASRRPGKNHTWSIDWTEDNEKQFRQALADTTPDPVNAISFHMQFGTLNDPNPRYMFDYHYFNRNVPVEEMFRLYVDEAKQQKKALFFGEFGDMVDMETAPDCPEKFREMCGLAHDAGVQVILLWQFQDYADEGSGAKKLDIIQEMNADLTAKGLLDTSAAWASHDPAEPESEENPTGSAEASSESLAVDTDKQASSESLTVDTDKQASSESLTADTDKQASSGCRSFVLPQLFLPVLVGSTVILNKRKNRKGKER